jgi:hypothetical protein
MTKSNTSNHNTAGSGSDLKLQGGHPQRRLDLLCRIVEGETVILNRAGGVLHRLNPTAALIWECCDGTSAVHDIVARITNSYDVDFMTCRNDVNETILRLQSLNLLTTKSAESHDVQNSVLQDEI